MDVKSLLIACREAGLEFRRLNEEYRDGHLEILATGGIDGMPHAKGPKTSSVEQIAVSLAELSCRVHSAEDRYAKLCKEAMPLILLCEDRRVQAMITARFVACLSWSGAAHEAGYSDRCNAIRDTWKGVELIQQKTDKVSRENT